MNKRRKWQRLAILAAGVTFSAVYGEDVGKSSSTGGPGLLSKALNPDLSLNGLFSLTHYDNDNPLTFSGGHDPKLNGFNIQQIELTLGASIDPYFRGDANLVLVPEGGEIKVEVEEAYAGNSVSTC